MPGVRERTRHVIFQRQVNGAAERVEAGALTVGAGGTVFQVAWVEVADAAVFLAGHPVEDLAVAAAGRAPAARAVPREVLRVEIGKGLTGGRIGALGGEPAEGLALRTQEQGAAFAQAQSFGQAVLEGGWRLAAGEIRDDEVDVVFAVAVELLELIQRDHCAVDAEHVVAVVTGPVGERLVVAFASAQEWGGEVKWRRRVARCLRTAAVRGVLGQQELQAFVEHLRALADDRFAAGGGVLDPDAGEQQA